MDGVRYFSGLDLGKLSDFTAFAVLQRRTVVEASAKDPFRKPYPGEPSWSAAKPERKKVHYYNIVRLERFDIGTPYDLIVDRMVLLYGVPPLANSILVPDKTGVGGPVCDTLHRARWDGVLRTSHALCKHCNGTGMIAAGRENDKKSCPYGVQRKHREKLLAEVRPVTITFGSGWKEDGAGGWVVSKFDLASNLQVVLQQNRLKMAPTIKVGPLLKREMNNFVIKIKSEKNATYEAMREGEHDDIVLAVAVAAWVAEKAFTEFWAA